MPRRLLPSILTDARLARAWDHQKNKEKPDSVSLGSKTPFWWKCEKCGNQFESSPNSRRLAKEICRKCATAARDSRNVERRGSLLKRYPDICAEWDYAANTGLDPSQLLPNTPRKAFWRCGSCSHQFSSRIDHRIGMGVGCPRCRELGRVDKHRAAFVKKSGSLSDAFPEIAKQWHPSRNLPLLPSQFTSGSRRKIWWRCKRGHSWRAAISNRIYGETDCPYCKANTSQLELRLFAELHAIFGNVRWREKFLGFEIDILVPDFRFGVEVDGFPWHLGKEDLDTRKTKTLEKNGFRLIHVRHELLTPLSAQDVQFSKTTDEKTTVGRLISRLMEIGVGKEHTLQQYLKSGKFIAQRVFDDISAFGLYAAPGKSLADLYPDIARQWDEERNKQLRPDMFTPGSSRKIWWKCALGHTWRETIARRVKGAICPGCSVRKATELHNLEILSPELLRFWDYKANSLSPKELTPKSNKIVVWRCANSHQFSKSPKEFAGHPNCPECNSVKHASPFLAVYWDHLRNGDATPSVIQKSSGKAYWWKCETCQTSWRSSPNRMRRVRPPTYCPTCRKRNKST
jgi:hypothetical protein